ncbi:helix-turn-helix transcriptional regulator [Parapusillimonas granuli]|uniref:Helix-turn-helix domain-containing protein n=1 Tax=Parapusillimonas granuli TaxID=380911 RepID=A0A853FWC3_9BURK|nr:helix-turn-helix transcriptional regulator [Parapusillimonas granuli]MBB5214689.1 transcriptional regulator with XRE-family HTH domain [Parapusillimonas granuli]MEB2398063.1 helix-turn-helix transcriptional regulator [Alcaligenaceae bacterium]NYT48903.1 helix-turn-helix domain-containing protein [Parapusillimonas granuli]
MQIRRKALGDFLRQARARVTPESLGLPAGSRRRTPGLRREEVAQLCGISATWYTWIEQGRNVSVSAAVLGRLASVLNLARAERHYLFSLAECADPDHGSDQILPLPPRLADCVRSITAPAYILDRCWNVLARNEPLLHLFDGWPDRDPSPNLLRYIFLDPAARSLVVDWEQRASRVVAEFRADAGTHADEPDVRAVLDELQQSSAVFAHWWIRHTVVDREGGLREFNHPADGILLYQQITFRLATRPDCKLVMLLENG